MSLLTALPIARFDPRRRLRAYTGNWHRPGRFGVWGLLLVFVLWSLVGPISAVRGPARPLYDDFNGPAGSPPDPRLWSYDMDAGWSKEQQSYTRLVENIHQNGSGHLVITAARAPDGSYTSARIKTQNKLNMGYGRVEASIMMPPGPGVLPAFWLLGSDYPSVGHPACGEIDIVEYVRSVFHFTLYGPQQGESDYRPTDTCGPTRVSGWQVSRWQVPDFDPAAGFHTYWAERSLDRITIGVDDVTTAVFTPDSLPAGGTWVFNDKLMFAIISFAVGSDVSWPGPPDATIPFSQVMRVDWFRYTPA